MNRNVSIVVIILILVAIAGYLVWIRSKVPAAVIPQATSVATPAASATVTASASATPAGKEATGSIKPKTATPGAVKK